jgi:hypothetical protein
MRIISSRTLPALAAFIFAALLAACQSMPVAEYSVQAYKNATDLKVETLALIAKSDEPYSSHRTEIEALTTKINAAYEFSAGLANNQLSTKQWDILRDPQGHLYGGYIRQWQKTGTVSKYFREQATAQIIAGFDQIICMESNKQAATSCGK